MCRAISSLALSVAVAIATIGTASAGDEDVTRGSVWVVELGGYGVLSPTYEGSKHYAFGFKPIFDFYQAGDKVWFSSPNDAFSIDLYSTNNFRAGLAADISLRSRVHGENVDWRIDKSDVNFLAGGFVEYYPIENVRTRAELLGALSGITGVVLNLSADYIWKPISPMTLSIGPRLQFVDDSYASQLYSTRIAYSTGSYVHYRAEGGLNYAGAEFTGTYDWTQRFSTKMFADYYSIIAEADSPRVSVKGSSDQFTVGIGASYKISVGTKNLTGVTP